MCNLYSVTTNQQAIRALAGVMAGDDHTGNLPPLPGLFPNMWGPVLRNGGQGRELAMARWGMPTPPFALLRGKPAGTDARGLRDPGTTNIRNTSLGWWRQWLGIAHRCAVPFNSFAEPDSVGGPPVWFAQNEDRPLMWFAGVWVPQWTSVRKVKDGATTDDLFGFLTTAPNRLVARFHDKAMPVILTTPAELEQWLNAPVAAALQLQRPLPDDALMVVARGEKVDRAA